MYLLRTTGRCVVHAARTHTKRVFFLIDRCRSIEGAREGRYVTPAPLLKIDTIDVWGLPCAWKCYVRHIGGWKGTDLHHIHAVRLIDRGGQTYKYIMYHACSKQTLEVKSGFPINSSTTGKASPLPLCPCSTCSYSCGWH